jgi:hypothetical protein
MTRGPAGPTVGKERTTDIRLKAVTVPSARPTKGILGCRAEDRHAAVSFVDVPRDAPGCMADRTPLARLRGSMHGVVSDDPAAGLAGKRRSR